MIGIIEDREGVAGHEDWYVRAAESKLEDFLLRTTF